MQKLCKFGLHRRLFGATVAALAVIVWGALFLIAPVWQFPTKPAAYLLPASVSGKSAAEVSATAVVDVNTATMEQLMTLPGIGEAKAAAIIAYREGHGRFSSLEELEQVNGISARMVQSWQGLALAGQ